MANSHLAEPQTPSGNETNDSLLNLTSAKDPNFARKLDLSEVGAWTEYSDNPLSPLSQASTIGLVFIGSHCDPIVEEPSDSIPIAYWPFSWERCDTSAREASSRAQGEKGTTGTSSAKNQKGGKTGSKSGSRPLKENTRDREEIPASQHASDDDGDGNDDGPSQNKKQKVIPDRHDGGDGHLTCVLGIADGSKYNVHNGYPYCHARLKSPRDLMDHLKSHGFEKSELFLAEPKHSNPPSTSRRGLCLVCFAGFENMETLSGHIKMHEKQKETVSKKGRLSHKKFIAMLMLFGFREKLDHIYEDIPYMKPSHADAGNSDAPEPVNQGPQPRNPEQLNFSLASTSPPTLVASTTPRTSTRRTASSSLGYSRRTRQKKSAVQKQPQVTDSASTTETTEKRSSRPIDVLMASVTDEESRPGPALLVPTQDHPQEGAHIQTPNEFESLGPSVSDQMDTSAEE